MKNFLKLLLVGLLCLAPTLGSDATQRVAALVSPQAIDVDLGFVQVGNVGNLSVMGAPGGGTFTLLNNPGGHFSIVGTEIVADPSTPAGQYSLSVQASGTGYSLTKTFVLNFSGVAPPVGEFFLGLNLSGLEDNGGAPTFEELTYWTNRGIKDFRIPLAWQQLQSTALAPITTGAGSYYSTLSSLMANAATVGAKLYFDFHNFGGGPLVNGFQNSGALTKGPWFGAGSGVAAPTATANAALSPDGSSMTATQIVIPAVTGANNFSVWAQATQYSQPFQATWSVYLRGSVGGEVVNISTNDGSLNWAGQNRAVLTTSWQRFTFTGTHTTGSFNNFLIGTDLRNPAESSTAAVTIFADWAEVQAGPTVTAYSPAPNPDTRIGVGLPLTALPDGWVKFSTLLRADPNFAVIGGYDPMNEWNNMDPAAPNQSTTYSQNLIFQQNQAVITALRAAGDNTLVIAEWDHFDGAWDAVANNIELLFTGIVDPANNWMASVHCYLNQNSSGNDYIWSQVIAAPGEAPPGLNVTVNIGPQRMAAVTALAAQHGVRLVLGETGFSNDFPPFGGAFDYADWNQAGFNMIDFSRQNKIPVFAWASGPGFSPGSYPLDPVPSGAGSYAVKDFTGAGVQGPQVTTFNQFVTNPQPQPTAYRSALPFAAVPYAPSGTPFNGLSVYYGGTVPSPVTFTGHATLPDGVTNVGGTFSSIGYPAGQNGFSVFSYTPSSTFQTAYLTFTNNAGLANPPPLGFSSQQDFFDANIGALAPNIYSLRLWNFSYIGPAVRLQRASDNAQMVFFFDNIGNLPRQAIQDWAGSRTIALATWYDQSGNGADLVFNPTTVNLILADTDGYPSVNIPSGAKNPTGGAVDFSTPSHGEGQLTIYSEINPANNNQFISQDESSDNYRISAASFDVSANGIGTTTVLVGASLNSWQTVTGTYDDLATTNNLKAYVSGTLAHQATAPQFVNAAQQNRATFGDFQFFSQPYHGSYRTLIIQYLAYTASNITTLQSDYTSYFTTPLPDPLTNVVPTISNAVANQAIYPGRYTSWPFSSAVVSDGNSPSPTDSVTITLSGAAGTLSGTGISGSGPYTIAAASPASVTATLQGAVFTTAAGVGSATTFTIAVTSSFGTSASNSTTSTVVTAYVAETPFAAPIGTFTPVNMKGVNLAGGENISGGTPIGQLPSNFQLDYFASKGFGLIRLPITGARPLVGSTTFGVLSSTYVNLMKGLIDHAFSLNMYVVIDPHGNGNIWAPETNVAFAISPASHTQDLFNDMWSRLATLFKNYPNVMFGLSNEPQQNAATWKTIADSSIQAIRAVGATQLILVPGAGFTNAAGWVSNGNSTAWSGYTGDPANNFAFEMHQYLDAGNSGGSPVATQNGSTVLAAATAWLVSEGFKGMLMEFGLAPDPWFPINLDASSSGRINNYDPAHGITLTTNSVTKNTDMLTYMQSHSSQWIGWAEWAGGAEFPTPTQSGGYCFNPEPVRGGSGYVIPIVDQPQISVLQAFL